MIHLMKACRRAGGVVLSALLTVMAFAPAHAGDAAAGKALFPVCTACHGAQGLGNRAMNAPKLAGQEPWYLTKQLKLFQSGARGTAPGDMTGMQMAAMSKGPQLQSDEALANLVAYIGTFPDVKPEATVTGDAAAGAQLYVVCAACHGQKAEGNEALGGPKLSNQNDWYLVAQIKKFKDGQRGYHESDHGGRQMRPMVGTLTDDKAINDVVAYIVSQE